MEERITKGFFKGRTMNKTQHPSREMNCASTHTSLQKKDFKKNCLSAGRAIPWISVEMPKKAKKVKVAETAEEKAIREVTEVFFLIKSLKFNLLT